MEKRVGIIGAGLSGLLACKYVIAKGFRPIVFEAKEEVGGVWNQTIESTKLQNSKQAFQFSDFPWPPSVTDMFPRNTEVLSYLQSYARHFALFPYIKFNSKVIAIDYVGDDDSHEVMQSWDLWGGGTSMAFGSKGKWNILVQEKNTNDLFFSKKEYYAVEFVILCIGRFSDMPNYPEFPEHNGPEVFDGKVLHSMDFSAMENATATELIKGKKVAIVGSNKSAVDLAAQCADLNGTNNPCTMVARTPHWMLPTPYLWGIHFASIYLNRFSELLVHKPGEGFMLAALAFLLSPLRWVTAKFAESYIRWKLPLRKYKMVPPHSFLQDMSSCHICALPENFYTRVEEGSLTLKRSNNLGFTKEGLILNGESQPLKADVVIMATGYRGDEKLKNIFASSIFQNYITGSPNSAIPLYRQIIHPRIPQLAVIGYSESLNNLHTYEMKCIWLAHFLDQKIQLPTIKEMEKEGFMWEKYMKRYSGKNYGYRRSCIGALHIWNDDQFCKDLGYNPRRKKGFLSDLFEPYGPADYLELTFSIENKNQN